VLGRVAGQPRRAATGLGWPCLPGPADL